MTHSRGLLRTSFEYSFVHMIWSPRGKDYLSIPDYWGYIGLSSGWGWFLSLIHSIIPWWASREGVVQCYMLVMVHPVLGARGVYMSRKCDRRVNFLDRSAVISICITLLKRLSLPPFTDLSSCLVNYSVIYLPIFLFGLVRSSLWEDFS